MPTPISWSAPAGFPVLEGPLTGSTTGSDLPSRKLPYTARIVHFKRQLLFCLFALHSLPSVHGQTAPAQPRYDLAILGGRLIEGSGAPAKRADLAIVAGQIAAIGTVRREEARETIDATNLVVAP